MVVNKPEFIFCFQGVASIICTLEAGDELVPQIDNILGQSPLPLRWYRKLK